MNVIAGIDFGSVALRASVLHDGEVFPFDHRFSAGRQPLLMENRPLLVGGNATQAPPLTFVSLKQKAGGEESITGRSGSRSIPSAITDIFRQLREDMRIGLPEPIEGAVIAVPSFFPDRPRNVLRQAALDAGFPRVKLFDEPLAALMGASNVPQSGVVLLYSMGAGMFSASVVKLGAGKGRTLSSEGDRFLGGFIFDAAIATLIAQRMRPAVEVNAANGPVPKLRRYAEQIKIGLSRREVEECDIDLFEVFDEQGRASLSVARSDLEGLIRGPLEDTIALSLKAIRDAGLSTKDLDLVFLSGGSTRIPLVEHLLSHAFEAPIIRMDDLAISRGAARQGALLDASEWKRRESLEQKLPEPPAPQVKPPEPPTPTVKPMEPSPRTGTWAVMFDSFLLNAETQWKQGDRENAISEIEAMVRSVSDYLGTLRHELGKSLFQERRFEQALVVMKKALEASPTDKHVLQTYHETMNQQARQLLSQGRLEASRKMIREALRINPRCAGCREVEEMVNKAWKETTISRFRRKR